MAKYDFDTKTVVLKKEVDEYLAKDIIEEKKTSVFRSLLRKPKKEDVHIHSIKLFYEAFLIVAGRYSADYYRKATHTINVEQNVKEVILGDGVFPISSKSSFRKKLETKRSKNKVNLELEEHVFVEEESQIIFDHHGKEIKFPFKINSKTIENYPQKILKNNAGNVKEPEITYDAAMEKLETKLKKVVDSDVRDIKEEFEIKEMVEAYVPIFEARLIGPKKKVGIIRLDAIRKKIL